MKCENSSVGCFIRLQPTPQALTVRSVTPSTVPCKTTATISDFASYIDHSSVHYYYPTLLAAESIASCSMCDIYRRFQTLLAADAGTTRLLFRSCTTRPGIIYIFHRRSSQLGFAQGGAGWRYSARHYTRSKCQGRSSQPSASTNQATARLFLGTMLLSFEGEKVSMNNKVQRRSVWRSSKARIVLFWRAIHCPS